MISKLTFLPTIGTMIAALVAVVLLSPVPSLAQPEANYQVQFINQAFTPTQNMHGMLHALRNAPELVGTFANTDPGLELIQPPGGNANAPPLGVAITLRRAVGGGDPTQDEMEDAVDGITQAQDGAGAVFDTWNWEVQDDDPNVTFRVFFTALYQNLQTDPNQRDDPNFMPPDSPTSIICFVAQPQVNDFGINYNNFDFSFNSAF